MTGQDAAYGLGKRIDRKWLFHEVVYYLARRPFCAAHEDDRQIVLPRPNFLCQLNPEHVRHGLIGDHDIHTTTDLIEQRQRASPVLGQEATSRDGGRRRARLGAPPSLPPDNASVCMPPRSLAAAFLVGSSSTLRVQQISGRLAPLAAMLAISVISNVAWSQCSDPAPVIAPDGVVNDQFATS